MTYLQDTVEGRINFPECVLLSAATKMGIPIRYLKKQPLFRSIRLKAGQQDEKKRNVLSRFQQSISLLRERPSQEQITARRIFAKGEKQSNNAELYRIYALFYAFLDC